jgi:hypothetical protein
MFIDVIKVSGYTGLCLVSSFIGRRAGERRGQRGPPGRGVNWARAVEHAETGTGRGPPRRRGPGPSVLDRGLHHDSESATFMNSMFVFLATFKLASA